jgi:hypothetical protein
MRKHDKRTLLRQKRLKKALPEDLAALLPPAPPHNFTPEETAAIVRYCDGLLAEKKHNEP